MIEEDTRVIKTVGTILKSVGELVAHVNNPENKFAPPGYAFVRNTHGSVNTIFTITTKDARILANGDVLFPARLLGTRNFDTGILESELCDISINYGIYSFMTEAEFFRVTKVVLKLAVDEIISNMQQIHIGADGELQVYFTHNIKHMAGIYVF